MTPTEELLKKCLAHLNSLANIRANLANHQASSFTDGDRFKHSNYHPKKQARIVLY
jgi:hypothetical protein